MNRLAAVTLAALLGSAGLAHAGGDAEGGRQLARVWCSSCHLVEAGGQAQDTAPPFPSIVGRHGDDAKSWIRGWLNDPHPPMPNFNLSRTEIDDIIAYLERVSAK